jgi:hypothetical protein
MIEKLKVYYNTFSVWIDKKFGFYLTNPANRWRWEKRQKERDLDNGGI